jgi:VIT1/CCC1 family predicted Fe2+/Mn2+ transporter
MSVHLRHVEQHFTGSEKVRDVVIGMSDGLTVPFALAAGLAGAVSNHWLVVIAGASELAAGSIAMGLGGYLAARGDADSYRAELHREQREIVELPDRETEEVREVFAGYGLTGAPLDAAVAAVTAKPESWLRFMMKEELGLDEPDPGRALASGLTIGVSYVAGGLVPLLPYFFPISVGNALILSAVVTIIVLAVFGGVKARFTGMEAARGALQTALLGGLAAGVAFAIARAISAAAGV